MRTRTLAAVLSSSALTAGLLVALPGTAHAATSLTPSQAVEQLNNVGFATLAATPSGFTDTLTGDGWGAPTTIAFDPVAQMRLTTSVYASGTQRFLSTPIAEYYDLPRDAATLAASTYAGKPAATWVYNLRASNPLYTNDVVSSYLLEDIVDGAPAPGQPTMQILTASTTTDGDGTRHWDVTSRDDSVTPAWLRSYSVTADPQNRLSAIAIVEGPTGDPTQRSWSEAVSYARPTLTMPTKAEVISSTTLALARDSIHLRARVGRVVLDVAAGANAYAAKRHRRVLPRDIQGYSKWYVSLANRSTTLIRWYTTYVGSVIYARNPFTRELVAYRVSVRSGKAVITRMA
ncbi:MAG TPA: hypothetical protein VFL59_09030 [Candidatus Nanopelagicales bacterium]|nr:hypothetical protein [Candidatus Nanopelagicales bacterium]